jgi:mannose-6-phosphate isomerase-like protein (cupin superfamily)
MPDYTHTNLKNLDDSAAGRGMDLEARFGRKHINSDHLGVSYFRYGADVKPPFGHRHGVQEEAYVVVSGSGRMRLEDETIDLKQWDVVRVAPTVLRGIQAGPDGIEMIVVGSDRPEEGDGEMVQGFWTE